MVFDNHSLKYTVTYMPSCTLANSSEKSRSCEAFSSAASQQISRILWKPSDSIPPLQQPVTCPYPEPDHSSSHPTPLFCYFKLYSDLYGVFHSVAFH